MKRTTLLTLATVWAAMAQAQNWFPTGATWHYGYMNGSFLGYVKVEVIGDTVIDGHACKTLDRRRETVETFSGSYYTEALGTIHAFDSAGVVWLFVPTTASFDTLYDFNAAPGNTWQLAPMPEAFDAAAYAQVVDTGTVLIDGLSLRWMAVDIWCPGSWSFAVHDTIIERIGTHTYLLPQDPCLAAVDGSEGGGLRCYADAVVNYTTGLVPDCDFILEVGERSGPVLLVGFPNPGDDRLTVRLPGTEVCRMDLLDATGRTVLSTPLATGSVQVDTGGLAPGVYTIRFDEAGRALTMKWIKR